ncbi:protein ZBED8-like [Centruroides sculpturatus]|uniref:protein ZBED8-like n=1 Tax=Centruroides sculpturatus TaxID=218467 RepID=UPI000C6DB457|nr:protein ZBED8-like [Centruroides sculpturatus]
MGFTCCGDKLIPRPKCIVCGFVLSNEAMVPSKLLRHFSTKHDHLSKKPLEYFKDLIKLQEKQKDSYLVAEIIAREMKPHTIGETLIRPAYTAIVRTIFGAEAKEEIKKIPLSNDTTSRRISDLSVDIENWMSQVIGGKAQLLAFTRFIKDHEILEEFLCCKEFEKTTTGKDVFDIMNTYFNTNGLSWKSCVGVCTDGARSIIGTIKGFVSYAKKENENIVTTHVVTM